MYIIHMTQINLHVTPKFEADLARLMKNRGIKNKSEAIRLAVREAATHPATAHAPHKRDWSVLSGFINRLPGGRMTSKTSAELLAEIDEEMEAKLERLACGTKPK